MHGNSQRRQTTDLFGLKRNRIEAPVCVPDHAVRLRLDVHRVLRYAMQAGDRKVGREAIGFTHDFSSLRQLVNHQSCELTTLFSTTFAQPPDWRMARPCRNCACNPLNQAMFEALATSNP